ncbi:RNA polymerase sigma-70 factor, ECF subfamily [Rubritalea squalenifaciens DSM 18772]|uniref:RNA polymerase sigma-70 factor, ECF subfamily n=2 Tax=Rubritalea TaxID=361050 RepID=A0A1M6B8G3_9BACT|nr:sigma-70 family RNA polymerase sigma factor [Rubritalea squalenifaciens]SHI45005.1 RNA polymerase sigma-70 factor, ECF subfamily [Rubritalea squalenifaciens DSM 18772]
MQENRPDHEERRKDERSVASRASDYGKRAIRVINPESPESMLEEIQSSLKAYIISLTANKQEVDDLLQETNHFLVESLAEYTPGTNFKAWAFSVARYRLLALRRDQKRSKLSFLSDEVVEMLADSHSARIPNEDHRVDALKNCIQRLAPGERSLLRKVYVEDVSMTMLADTLGRTANALHKSLSRVRQALKVCIERQISNRP